MSINFDLKREAQEGPNAEDATEYGDTLNLWTDHERPQDVRGYEQLQADKNASTEVGAVLPVAILELPVF